MMCDGKAWTVFPEGMNPSLSPALPASSLPGRKHEIAHRPSLLD